MVSRWFYARGEGRKGPYSGQQLKGLAASGDILPTDTVWKEGVEKGVPASRVEHLFAPAAPAAAPEPVPLTDDARLLPLEPEAPKTGLAAAQAPARKGRASAGRGAVIVGQDGVNVTYKKKCTTCNHTESFSHTTLIREGAIKAAFFCPKCRKNRQVEIKGSMA